MSIVNGLVCDGLSQAGTAELAKMVGVSPRGGYYSVTDAKGKKNAVLSWELTRQSQEVYPWNVRLVVLPYHFSQPSWLGGPRSVGW